MWVDSRYSPKFDTAMPFVEDIAVSGKAKRRRALSYQESIPQCLTCPAIRTVHGP